MAAGDIPELSIQLRKKVGIAVSEFQMIEENDRILIGLSGGKDSLVLTVALSALRRRSPVPFSLSACTVDLTGGTLDTSPLEAFCKSLGIPFFVRPYPVTDIIRARNERSPCSFCANIRRGILNGAAREAGCRSLALGHNLDDAVETVLLNLFHTGRFRSFQPKSLQSRSGVTLIRPLVLVEERRVLRDARRLGLPVLPYVCPFSLETERARAKKIVEELSARNPRIKYNIVHALRCLDGNDRWGKPEEPSFERAAQAGPAEDAKERLYGKD